MNNKCGQLKISPLRVETKTNILMLRVSV